MRKKLAFTVLSCLLALLLGGCFCFDVPPDVDAVQQQFLDHYADIQTITEFMTDAGYENIYLDDSGGTVLVVDAAARLLDRGRYSEISKRGNTISFTRWIGLRDIRCGIAYTIHGSDLPEVEFTT